MEAKRTGFGTFARLSGMMFLQFAIWGTWAVLIAGHMQNLGFKRTGCPGEFAGTAPLCHEWVRYAGRAYR